MARSSRMSRIKYQPSGGVYISDSLSTIIIIILLVALIFLLYAIFFIKPQSPTIIMPKQTPPQTTVIPIKGGDSRYDMAPQPLRDWMAPPEFPPRGGIASIPINIPTQGLPESFQSVGMININGDALPLYGRRTNASSNRWNYYTRTNTFNPVPIPLRISKRDCMDQVGCDELMSGDNVNLEGLGQHGKVNMYRFDGPKYIPGLI
jgi:hypothetical protein